MPDAFPFTADLAASLAARAGSVHGRPVVLVDGRSGSGKTTLGRALAPLLRAQLVELDDVYPGWHGLGAAATTVATSVLRPEAPGYRRWDWERSSPSDWRRLDPSLPLVVEGSGAITPASAELASLRVWVELDEPTRRARVAKRSDADAYAPWWDLWAAQESQHIAVDRPQSFADVIVGG